MSDHDKPKPALEDRDRDGERLFSPSAARNREPIRDVFVQLMPRSGKILEIGSGTGEHGVFLAAALPDVTWHAGDPDEGARQSIAGWIEHSKLENFASVHAIDVTKPVWGVEDDAPFDGVVSINMIHIAPFDAAKGLFAGASRLLRPDGRLFLYGPFSRRGRHIAPSNETFDESLKLRNREWGVRDLEQDILPLAQKNSFRLETIVEMPSNNLSVVFRKTAE